MATPSPSAPRPRQVTIAGVQAIIGGVAMTVVLVGLAAQLNSNQISDLIREVVQRRDAVELGLTVDTTRNLLRIGIMAGGVLSVTSFVLGFFVLRRHRPARIALTVVGAFAALLSLFGGPSGWLFTLYIAVSLGLLWTKEARAWFANPHRPAVPPPSGQGWPPPPGQGGWGPPPPPPPPPPPSR